MIWELKYSLNKERIINKISVILLFLFNVYLTSPVNANPEINRISSKEFRYGDTLTISGRNFGIRKDKNVYFNELESLRIIYWSDTLIQVIVPHINSNGVILIKENLSDSVRFNRDYSIFERIIITFVQSSLLFTLLSLFFIIKKLWKRRHLRIVSESQSIFGWGIYIFIVLLWICYYCFIEMDYLSLVDTALYSLQGFILFLIATGVFYKYKGKEGFPALISDLIKQEAFELFSFKKNKNNLFKNKVSENTGLLDILETNIMTLEQANDELFNLNEEINKKNSELSQLNLLLNEKNVLIETERQKSDNLLLNILPASIADRLKNGEIMIADQVRNVSIIFIDIYQFTKLASQMKPKDLVNLLNNIFTDFDLLTEKFGLEKIKTIGDCYMAVSGLLGKAVNHAESAALMALEAQEILKEHYSDGSVAIRARIGIDSGNIIAGVIGKKKFIYDLWGDTVNTASRMESQGVVDKIQVTENTHSLLNDKFIFEDRGLIDIKGKYMLHTYFLIRKI